MARNSRGSAQERDTAEDAVIIEGGREVQPAINLPEGMMPDQYDPDSESSWDDWSRDLHSAQASGSVKAYKLPLDDRGQAIYNAKGSAQIYLGAWAHDQYSFDNLLAMIKRDYFKPGEYGVIRLTGHRAGAKGVQFNRVVPIQRSAQEAEPAHNNSQFGEVLNAMQVSNNATMQLVERLTAPKDVRPELPKKSGMETAKEFAIVLTPIIVPIVTALLTRPKPQSDITQMITALGALQKMTQGGNDQGGDDESTTVSIIKAVAGPGLQLLNTLAGHRQPAPVPQRRRLQSPMGAAHGANKSEARAPVQVTATTQAATGERQAPVHAESVADTQIPSEIKDSLSAEEMTMLNVLRPQIEELCVVAASGASAEDTAKLLMNTLPANDQIDNMLADLVSNQENFNRLFLLVPKMKEHAAWFEQLRVAIASDFESDEKESA